MSELDQHTSLPPRADLTGRKILVTGANRGLGRSLVDQALARGAETVVATARDSAALGELRRIDRVVAARLDVRDTATIDAVASEHPDVELVVSNAAVTMQSQVLETEDLEDVRMVFDTNVLGPLRLVRAFQGAMRRPEAGVVFVLSIAAVTPSRSSPIYSASKAAGLMIALAAREELRESGATVTVAFPGYIDTDMARDFPARKAAPEDVAARILDAWADGRTSVWPDVLSGLVGEAIGAPFQIFLNSPREAMVPVLEAFDREG